MRRFSIFVFFIGLLFYGSIASAQDTLSKGEFRMVSDMIYDPTGSPQNVVSNQILREIAQSEVISLKKIHLAFKTGIRVALLRLGGTMYLKISLEQLDCSGDHHYRKFSYTESVKPGLAKVSIQLRSAQDSLIVSELTDVTLETNRDDSIPLPGLIASGNEIRPFVTLENLRLYYGDEDLVSFRKYRRLVDDYYACTAVIDSLEPGIRSMDYKRTSEYPGYYLRMIEIGRIERLTGERDFSRRLSPPGFDPGDLAGKYENLLRFSRSFAMTFGSVLDTLPVLNTALPERTLIHEYVQMIRRYIRWSFLINERNGSIYREYLDRFYEMTAFGDDYGTLVKLAGRTYPGLNGDSIARLLLCDLKRAYETDAEQCTASSQYAEAVELLDNLRRLEDKFPFLYGTASGKDTRYLAAYGIYSSYLGVAENSLNAGRPSIALGYIEKAAKYVDMSGGLIVRDTLFLRILARYHSTALAECDAFSGSGDFQSSLACYTGFLNSLDSADTRIFKQVLEERITRVRESIYLQMMTEAKILAENQKADSALIVYDQAVTTKKQIRMPLPLSPAMDSLKPVIDKYRYSRLIREAGEFNIGMQYKRAYAALTQAYEIAEQQHLPDDPILDSLRRRVSPRYVDELLAGARPLIWANRFAEAGKFADSLEQSFDRNGIAGYPEVREAFAGFRKRISDRICWQASDGITVLMIRSERYVASRNFPRAVSLLDSAQVIALAHTSCALTGGSVPDSLDKYRPPAHYQEMISRLNGNVSLGIYSGFMEQFTEAHLFFKKSDLERYGLKPLSLYDYVEERSREGLTMEVMQNYLGRKEYYEAFRYLLLLKNQGLHQKEAEPYLKILGKEMALADKSASQLPDPAEMIRKYTGGDEWFAIFGESYMKEWGRR